MGLTKPRASQIFDIDYKQATRVITVSNVTLTGGAPSVVDGVSLTAGDRVLVTGQSTGSENGLYAVAVVGIGSDGTWVRTNDGNEDGEIQAGMIVMVTEGATYADTQWKLTTDGTIDIGTTALVFAPNTSESYGNVEVAAYLDGSAGDIIPIGNNIQSLGSATFQWKDVFVGPGSLYVNNQKVLEDNSGTITLTADVDQNLSILTTGNGDIEINPGGLIQLKGNVEVSAGYSISQAGGAATNFNTGIATDSITSSTADTNLTLSADGTGYVYVNDNLVVAGNLTVNGDATNLSVTNLTVQDNIITIAAEQTGTPALNAGISVQRGDENNTLIRWTEGSLKWQFTNDGSTYQTIIGTGTNEGSISVTGNINSGNITTAGTVNAGSISATGASNIGDMNVAAASAIDFNTSVIGNIGTPVADTDAATKAYVDSSLSTSGFSITDGVTTEAIIAGDTVEFEGDTNITVLVNQVSGTESNVALSLNDDVVIGNSLSVTANVSAGNVNGTRANFTNLVGTLETATQTNITSVGTLGSLSVTGNVSAGNVDGTTGAFTTVTGAGSGITSLNADELSSGTVQSGRLSGTYTIDISGSATTAGTVTTAAQPNITSVGTLTSITVTANVSAGNVDGTRANFTNLVGTLETATQTNITSVGTLTSVTASGNITTTGNININARQGLYLHDSDSSHYVAIVPPATVASNVTFVLPGDAGTSDYVLSTNGAGTLSWIEQSGGGGSGASSFPNSTVTPLPSSEGNFDLSYNYAQTTQETPFESGGTDAFGVSLGEVYSMMDPAGDIPTPTDLGILA